MIFYELLYFQVTCSERVYKQLKCEHNSQPVACTGDGGSIVCHEIVEIPRPECARISSLSCSITQNEATMRTVKFNAHFKTLLCGHKHHLACAEGADESVHCLTMVT